MDLEDMTSKEQLRLACKMRKEQVAKWAEEKREKEREKQEKLKKNKGIIDLDKKVRVTDMGGIYEVMCVPCMPPEVEEGGIITKITNDIYMVNTTGELKRFKHKDKRVDNIKSLKKSMKTLRALINTNFFGERNEGFWTLTYRDNMTDPKQLHDDFRNFWKRYKRWAKKEFGTDKFEYINVVEPQGRGAWHCHVLVKCEELERLFVPNEVLANLWGHGFVKIKGLTEVDNVGAYLSAYFADIEFSEEEKQAVGVDTGEMCKMASEGLELVERVVDGQKKKFIKGGRLHLYPTAMKFYRTTRGIKKPTVEWIKKEQFMEKVEYTAPHFCKEYEFEYKNKKNEVRIGSVSYEHYNVRKS